MMEYEYEATIEELQEQVSSLEFELAEAQGEADSLRDLYRLTDAIVRSAEALFEGVTVTRLDKLRGAVGEYTEEMK